VNALHKHAEHLLAAGAAIGAAGNVIVDALAEVVRGSVSRQIGQDVPRRRVAGVPVDVKVRRLPAEQGVARVQVTATGPLHLENNPTKPHSIAPKGPHPLAFQVGGRTVFVNKVQHPGTRGKRTWQQGVDKALPLVDQQVEREGVALLRKLLP
jgi:hypothetical protein